MRELWRDKRLKARDKNEDVDLALPISENPVCVHCGSPRIDTEIKKAFRRNLCADCRTRSLELITKTACYKDYLLDKHELDGLQCLKRPNPHKGSWAGMRLYMKDDVERAAISKHGSLEEISCIISERRAVVMERKKARLKKRIGDLRRKTLLGVDTRSAHVHAFKPQGGGTSRCECGLEIEEEEI